MSSTPPDGSKITITDPRGRVFTLKRPNVLQQLDLVEMVGAENAQNQVYMSMVLPVLYLAEVNGEPEHLTTKRQLRALIQRLDDDGLAALAAGVRDHFLPKTTEEAEAKAKK